MIRVLTYGEPERLVGLLVSTLGLMVGALFALADIIGMGTNNYFGPMQTAGTALGALIIVGGLANRYRLGG